MKALTQPEVLKVLKAAADNPTGGRVRLLWATRDHAMILMAFRHGMRASEVCNLELKDLDLRNNEVVIRRLKGSLKTTQPIADVPGQPLLSERRVLRDWLKERGQHPSKYLFVSQKSGKVNRSTFYRIFSDAAERAGLPADKRHPHCLKHALGYALVDANVNLSVIKQALGHRSIQSTSRYTEATDEQAGRAVVAALASL